MELDLARLRALVAVVDHGSFDAAAEALHVTASAVSQRIRALEHDVGRVLLVRARPVRATEHGAALLRLARQLEVLAGEAEQVLRDDAIATLPIAVNSDSLITWVLPALAPLAGEILFEFQRDDQTRTTELLRNGTVVAAISSDRETVQGCAVRPLGAMRYLPVATPEFRARWFGEGRPGFAAAPSSSTTSRIRCSANCSASWAGMLLRRGIACPARASSCGPSSTALAGAWCPSSNSSMASSRSTTATSTYRCSGTAGRSARPRSSG